MVLRTPRLVLRQPAPADARSYAAYRVRNKESHAWTEPSRDGAYYTAAYWRAALSRSAAMSEQGEEFRFAGFLTDEPDQLVCMVNLYAVVRGPIQNALMGYSVDDAYRGQGLATEAVRAVVAHAFADLDLMRIEAGVLPENQASVRVLQKSGFERVGTMRKSLCVVGQWRDHDLYDQTNPAWQGRYP